MFCPECGKSIPEQSKFCIECGVNINEYKVVVSTIEKPIEKPQNNMWKCKNCNTDNVATDFTCVKCLANKSYSDTYKPDKTKAFVVQGKTILIVGVALVALISVILFVTGMFSSRADGWYYYREFPNVPSFSAFAGEMYIRTENVGTDGAIRYTYAINNSNRDDILESLIEYVEMLESQGWRGLPLDFMDSIFFSNRDIGRYGYTLTIDLSGVFEREEIAIMVLRFNSPSEFENNGYDGEDEIKEEDEITEFQGNTLRMDRSVLGLFDRTAESLRQEFGREQAVYGTGGGGSDFRFGNHNIYFGFAYIQLWGGRQGIDNVRDNEKPMSIGGVTVQTLFNIDRIPTLAELNEYFGQNKSIIMGDWGDWSVHYQHNGFNFRFYASNANILNGQVLIWGIREDTPPPTQAITPNQSTTGTPTLAGSTTWRCETGAEVYIVFYRDVWMRNMGPRTTIHGLFVADSANSKRLFSSDGRRQYGTFIIQGGVGVFDVEMIPITRFVRYQ